MCPSSSLVESSLHLLLWRSVVRHPSTPEDLLRTSVAPQDRLDDVHHLQASDLREMSILIDQDLVPALVLPDVIELARDHILPDPDPLQEDEVVVDVIAQDEMVAAEEDEARVIAATAVMMIEAEADQGDVTIVEDVELMRFAWSVITIVLILAWSLGNYGTPNEKWDSRYLSPFQCDDISFEPHPPSFNVIIVTIVSPLNTSY